MLNEEQSRARRIVKVVFLVSVCLATIYPVLWVFKMAFTPVQGFDMSVNPIPSHPSLENFRSVLFDRPFFMWLRNSVIVSGATTLLGVFLASTSAYALSRFRFPGR